MHHFRGAIIILSLVFGLVACTKPNTDPNGVHGDREASASFYIDTVSGRGELEGEGMLDAEKRTRGWTFWRSATYHFTACVLDRASGRKAQGHKFTVQIPETKQNVPVIGLTTPDGCFRWTETIPFSFFVKRSRWVVVERDILGEGVHRGVRRIRLAINPWTLGRLARDDGKTVFFLDREPVSESKLLRAKNSMSAFGDEDLLGKDELFIDDVSIQTLRKSERSTGTQVQLNISMTPKLLYRNSDSPEKSDDKFSGARFMNLPNGNFFIIGHLVMSGVGKEMDERVVLTNGGKPVLSLSDEDRKLGVTGVGQIRDGKLIGRLDAWIDGKVPQGQLKLVLKVIPRGVRGIESFEGIYDLGTLRSLSGNKSGELIAECRDSNTGCKIAPYLNDPKTVGFAKLREQNYASDNSPYLFDRVKLRFIQVLPGETTMHREVAYSATTCVVDAFTGDSLIGQPFTISYKNQREAESYTKVTDNKGCLTWQSKIPHEYYMPEAFQEREVVISKGKVEKSLKFYLNPWDDKFTFGFDELEFPPQLKEAKKVESRFFLADFGYHTIRFQYNIDSLMDLEVKKTVLMELDPRVLRYSGIINARKMTEPLRDGIWLMKVAIQKNYLDPAQPGVLIQKLQPPQSIIRLADEPAGSERRLTRKRLREMNIQASTNEYITTQTTLVRVTDGVIIQPITLKMRDLRMMRVRNNFLIQLEPVDEIKLQNQNVANERIQKAIEKLLEERKANAAKRADNVKSYLDAESRPDELTELRKDEEAIEAKVKRKIEISRAIFDEINKRLTATHSLNVDDPEVFAMSLMPRGYTAEELSEVVSQVIELVGKKREDGTYEVAGRLTANDFTNIKLPTCDEIDCTDYKLEDAGLKPRTFVGPVIFLHNGYKDSVRATDNLDEAKCGQVVERSDVFEAKMHDEAMRLFKQAETSASKERQNTFYSYSEYFGSLRHLCGKDVDDLIEREEQDRKLFEKSGPAVASIYNFAQTFDLNFMSLKDEQPKSVDFSAEEIARCGSDLVSCMKPTTDRWVQTGEGLETINRYLNLPNLNSTIAGWFGQEQIKETPWTVEDMDQVLFKYKGTRARQFVGCTLLVSQYVKQLQQSEAIPRLSWDWPSLERMMVSDCALKSNTVFWDRKLRVFKTGQDGTSYTFLGGLQLNINVGQGFSVGRSQGYNWGWSVGGGIDAVDFLGPAKAMNMVSKAGGEQMGNWMKPLSLKAGVGAGYGEGFSSSNGTSVSDSTYLVAQIAGFRVRLDEYERCHVASFSNQNGLEIVNRLNRLIYYKKKNQEPVVPRGMVICEGVHQTEPKQIKESYFYFTQHFTEGDMLDGADLYNHPWLLALRGQRDFGRFLARIRKQESLTLGNFVKGVWNGSTRQLDWPLAELSAIYRQVKPSFPGFYTVLEEGEGGTPFPLEKEASMVDTDPNFELISKNKREFREKGLPANR
ncbi:MAG: hypothetical protein AB7F86_11315 [Bdellovibrionales bacterium]